MKRWELSGYDAKGKQIRKRFNTPQLAEGAKHSQEMQDMRVINNATTVVTRLSPEQVLECERLIDLLPNGITLSDAVKGFLKGYDPSVTGKTVRDALTEFLGIKERENLRPLTVDNLRRRIGKFVSDNREGLEVREITHEVCSKFLDAFNAKNSNNYRRQLSQFFDFCVEREYMSMNPLKVIRAKKEDADREPLILEIQQAKSLLKHAVSLHNGDLLPYVCLGMFAGLRPISELEALDWKDIDLDTREIYVRRSKNRNHIRYVPIEPALAEWLKLCIGKPIISKNNRRKLARLKQSIGFKGGIADNKQRERDAEMGEWQADTLRHTYGSYLYASVQDVGNVASKMGNSPQVVQRHYRRAVKAKDAKTFWQLTPEKVLKENKENLKIV